MSEAKSSPDILGQEIRTQSEKEADSILNQANAEAAQIIKRAQEQGDEIRHEILKKAQAQADQVKRKILSSVHLEVKRQKLNTREKILSQLFQLVESKLEAFSQDKVYASFLKKLVVEGILAIDSESVRLLPGQTEKVLLTKQMLGQIKKEVQSTTGWSPEIAIAERPLPDSGVVIVSSDERMLFDNRFKTRIQRNQNEMRLEAVKRIFNE